MLLFLILLIAAFAVIGVYAAQNPGVQDVNLWQYHWTGIPQWVPVATAALVIALLFMLYPVFSSLLTGLRHGTLRRRIASHEAVMSDLQAENRSLREANTRLESEVKNLRSLADRSVAAGSAQPGRFSA